MLLPFMKGQRCDPGDYRPVSLTLQVGKLFERIVRNYMVRFLEENKLPSQQFFWGPNGTQDVNPFRAQFGCAHWPQLFP